MKTTIPQLAALSLALVPTAAYSQYAYTRLATFALVESSTIPALPAKDSSGKSIPGAPPVFQNTFTTTAKTSSTTTTETGAKPGIFKISNKEILQVLEQEGVIETIVGYSITELYTDNSTSEGGDTARFYLTKRGEEPIDIDDFIRLNASESYAASTKASAKTTATTNLVTDAETRSATASFTDKSLVSLSLNFSWGSFSTGGMSTLTRTLRILGSGEGRYVSFVPSAGKVSGLVGYGVFVEEEDPTLLEGSISLAAGVAINLAMN
jgi:hypothetical protein